MNTKDFIVLPWGKPGNSVKLKYKNSQELKMEKVQLELENREMEKTLQEFQSTRSKAQEGRHSTGYHWKSGQVGKLGNQSHTISQNKGNVFKLSSGRMKLKLLKEQLQEPMKQRHCNVTSPSDSARPVARGRVCGQCEDSAAVLVCLECGEDYCSGCFAKIHQKGALRLHRTSLLQEKSPMSSSVLGVAHQFIKEVNPNACKEHHFAEEITKNQHKRTSALLQEKSAGIEASTAIDAEHETLGLLCAESFDEEASAESFQEALRSWRAAQREGREEPDQQGKTPESQEISEAQTDLKIWREPLNIEFKEDSLSYMEKLWLKKHRRTPREKLWNMIPDTFIRPCQTPAERQCARNESSEDSDVNGKKMQHQASFLPEEEINVEPSKPALKIIELSETSEEELEQTGNIVPYKVELAGKDGQLSDTSHDYLNTFLYESGVLSPHVFIKEKAGLLRLHLSNGFSSCKDKPKGTSNTAFKNTACPDAYSPAIEETEKNEPPGRSFENQCRTVKKAQSPDGSHISHERKDLLPSTDSTNPSRREKLSDNIKEPLAFNNIQERSKFEDSETPESPLLLQEMSPNSKPVTEQHQGLEMFFNFDKNERHKLFPSHSLEFSYSATRITDAGDRKWIPDHSVGACADRDIALGVVQSARNPSWSIAGKRAGEGNPEAASPP